MKRVLKWGGVGLLVLLVILATGVGTVSCISDSRIAERYEVDPEPVEVPTDEASLVEGERLYLSRGCGDCHAADGGGRVIMDGPPGRVVGANLTRLTTDMYTRYPTITADDISTCPARDRRPRSASPGQECA